MQFREQGRKVQCIRSTYDPATKRSYQKVIASFSRWADTLPSDEVADLTEAERGELAAWFEARQAEKENQTNQYRATYGARTLADLAAAIRAADALDDAQAVAIWQGLADVAKALRKAGHPKPKRQHPAPAVLPGQGDLLDAAPVVADPALPAADRGV